MKRTLFSFGLRFGRGASWFPRKGRFRRWRTDTFLWSLSIIVKVHICLWLYSLLLSVTFRKVYYIRLLVLNVISALFHFESPVGLFCSERLSWLWELLWRLLRTFFVKGLFSSWLLLSHLDFVFLHYVQTTLFFLLLFCTVRVRPLASILWKWKFVAEGRSLCLLFDQSILPLLNLLIDDHRFLLLSLSV